MRKALRIIVLVSMSFLVVVGSGVGCAEEEEEKELLAPQIEILEVISEATLDPTDPNDLGNKGIVLDMAYEISNPNDFEIAINPLRVEVSVDGTEVQRPNILDRFHIPAETTVVIRRMFVYKPMDVMINLMVAGKTFEEAMGPALGIWTKATSGTATWDATCLATIASEFGDLTKTYELSWEPVS